MPTSKYFFNKFPGEVFIETGTYMGQGVIHAMNAGYEEIISIELSKVLFEDLKEKFSTYKNVTIIQGNSHKILPEMLKKFSKKKIVLWLDAHYSECGTADEDPNPLLKELDAIIQLKESELSFSPTILIDDMRTFTHNSCGFSETEILEKVMKIDKNYLYTREDGFQEETGRIFHKDIACFTSLEK